MEYWQGMSLKDPDWDFERDVLPILQAVQLDQYADDLKRIILGRWGEPWRYYHAIGHFIDGPKKLWEIIQDLPPLEQQILILAWIFHDAVYVPGADLNEWASAKLAEAWLEERDFERDTVHIVNNLVIDSKYHRPIVGDSVLARLSRLLYDVDLSRFAGPPKFVIEDRALLFKELGGDMYEADFFAANRDFVRTLITHRSPLYHSPQFTKYNAAAEANISAILKGEL